MKKIFTILALAGICSLTQATTINAPASLTGSDVLSGQDAYTWGVGINLAAGQTVNSASITFSDITLTAANTSGTGYLYTDLINASLTGVHAYNDNDNPGDFFKTAVSSSDLSQLGSEFFKSVGTTLSWTIVLNSTQLASLNSYLADGIFDIGLDPDCHYNVGNICFNYTTTTPHTVPDNGMTVFLLGISLLGLEVVRRQVALRNAVARK